MQTIFSNKICQSACIYHQESRNLRPIVCFYYNFMLTQVVQTYNIFPLSPLHYNFSLIDIKLIETRLVTYFIGNFRTNIGASAFGTHNKVNFDRVLYLFAGNLQLNEQPSIIDLTLLLLQFLKITCASAIVIFLQQNSVVNKRLILLQYSLIFDTIPRRLISTDINIGR